jgi:MoxR-like ATPase
MPFVTLPLLEAALDGLRGKHPLGVLVIPAMVQAGVTVTDSPDKGVEYGSGNEVTLLEAYFKIPGAPPAQPYRAIWETNSDAFWRDDRYPGRALQRMRTDRVKEGRGFFQKKTAGGKDLWGLRPDCGPDLVAADNSYGIRIADLAIWYGRNQDSPNLAALIAWFLSLFPITKDKLVGTVYTDDIPSHYEQIPFGPDPLSQTELAEALGGKPEPVKAGGDLQSLTVDIETCLSAKGFILPGGLVGRVLSAFVRGDFVVLVGAPGTGKTKFANLLEECLRERLGELTSSWIAVRPEFDEAEFIGYERLDGKAQLQTFAIQVLKSEQPLGPHLVVLEEFNLARLEEFMASVLIAAQDPERRITLPGGEQVELPVDAFILATCNSYLDEPETRLRLSFPSKRRASVIYMSNVLLERFQDQGAEAVVTAAVEMIRQEQERVAERRRLGLGTTLDDIRFAALSTVTLETDLSAKARDRLVAIATVLLGSPEGKEFFTLGLLRDVALALAFARRDEAEEMAAIGGAIADKVVHQLRGPKSRADDLLAAVGDLPNRAEIARLLDRMKSSPSDELLQIL